MRTHVAYLVVVGVLLWLCALWNNAASHLIVVNNDLQGQVVAMQTAPHPVHDAELTIWHETDGSILIVVNGMFKHRMVSPCGSRNTKL